MVNQRDRLRAFFRAALSDIASRNRLCIVQLYPSNSGIAASISFNTVEHSTPDEPRSEGGRVEFALRQCRLKFTTAEVRHDLRWAEEVVDLKHRLSTLEEVRIRERSRDKTQYDRIASGELRGSLGSQFGFAETSAEVSIGATDNKHRLRDRRVATDSKFERPISGIEMEMGLGGVFMMRFSANLGDDLVAMNSETTHVPLLTCDAGDLPLPSAMSVSITSPLDKHGREIGHALRIRHASGIWNMLASNKRKALVAEILFNEFLKPLHVETQLWPPEEFEQ